MKEKGTHFVDNPLEHVTLYIVHDPIRGRRRECQELVGNSMCSTSNQKQNARFELRIRKIERAQNIQFHSGMSIELARI